MADYFTSDHFKLLNKWKGQKRDESNPEQNRAYEDDYLHQKTIWHC